MRIWAARKLPRFDDRNTTNIIIWVVFLSIESRGFGAAEISHIQLRAVYKKNVKNDTEAAEKLPLFSIIGQNTSFLLIKYKEKASINIIRLNESIFG